MKDPNIINVSSAMNPKWHSIKFATARIGSFTKIFTRIVVPVSYKRIKLNVMEIANSVTDSQLRTVYNVQMPTNRLLGNRNVPV